MSVDPADFARALFAFGYFREAGHKFPLTPRAYSAMWAIGEAASDTAIRDPRKLAKIIHQEGRIEGRRAHREVAHAHLYKEHAALIGATWRRILKRVPKRSTSELLAHAHASTAAGDNPVHRRSIITPIAAAMIRPHLTPQDWAHLDALNANGWQHAAAYGTAEANSTPRGGKTPPPAHVGPLAGRLAHEFANGAPEGSHGWSNTQLLAVAAAAALVAGKGLPSSADKVSAALSDGMAAENSYVDSLHATVVTSYVTQTSGLYPGALYNLVTATNPCDECISLELQNPYAANDIPDVPVHPNCQCNIELASEGDY